MQFPKAAQAQKFLAESDERLRRLITTVGPIRIELDPNQTVFQSLASAIVYQQLHGKAAATILKRFILLYGSTEEFPEPQAVLGTPLTRLRSAGLSAAKSAAILDLARKVVDQTVPAREQADQMSDAEIIESLTQVRGIGRWTVEMFLIFTLGRTDVLPIHDYGVRKGFSAIFKKRELTPKRLEALGVKWSPYRSALSWYCWRALEIPEYQARRPKKAKRSVPAT